MSNNRHPIDSEGYDPVNNSREESEDDGGDEEEDLVYSEGLDRVTDHDRDLLRADKEVLKALNQKGRSSPKLGSSFLPKPKRKVKFGGEYQQVGDKSGNRRGDSMDSGNNNSNNSHDKNYSGNNGRGFEPMQYAEDDDDFSDSDIEIDVPRRKRRHKAVGKKLHILLAILLLLAGFLFVSKFMDPNDDEKDDDTDEKNKQKLPEEHEKKLLSNGTHDFYPSTIIISLDGFHPHYVNKDLTPNLHDLYTNHASAPYMKPAFPSSTFPNHWTLITGLYPENHGIVGNTFYDPILEKQFFNTKPGQSLSLDWWGGEPIWQTASEQDVKTSVHMWPGSEAPWDETGDAPMEVDKYNGTEKLSVKANKVLKWLDRGDIDKRPELMLTYVPTVDSVGHKYGISGPELKKALKDVDDFVGQFRNGIKERKLEDIVNLIIVSDHGMAPTSNERIIYLEDLVDMDKIDHVDGWPLIGIRPKEHEDVDTMYEALKKVHEKHENSSGWSYYLRDEFPSEYHFGDSEAEYSHRLADLWIIPHVGWSITTRKQMDKMDGVYKPFGVHGYNNSESLMRALFTATGPYFKDHKKYEPFENVNIYNILCDTLDIKPSHNDGEKDMEKALKELSPNWKDSVEYPNVDFHTEVLKIDSTFDQLYSPRNDTTQNNGTGGESTHSLKEPEGKGKDPIDGPHAASEAIDKQKGENSQEDKDNEGWKDWFKGEWSSVKGWVSDKYHGMKDWASHKLEHKD